MTSPPARKLRILALHGFTQSGPLFRAKTRALEKSLQKHFPAAPKQGYLRDYPGGVECIYPTGPISLKGAEIPGFDTRTDLSSSTHDDPGTTDQGAIREEAYAWWRRKDAPSSDSKAVASGGNHWAASSSKTSSDQVIYDGLPETLDFLANFIRTDGPFDAVMGFSQGGAMAAILAALLEPGRQDTFAAAHDGPESPAVSFPESFLESTDGSTAGAATLISPQFRFALIYSAFRAPSPMYAPFYAGGLSTPTLQFIGSVDTVVSEERSLGLVDACRATTGGPSKANDVAKGGHADAEERHRVVYHPGGHFVPAGQRAGVDAVVAFVREVLEGPKANGKEESVEDMDMPF